MRLLRTPIPQPPTPTLLKVMDFLKSLENSENLPDYREYSKHHEDYFLFEVVALLLLNFELGSYGVWGLWVNPSIIRSAAASVAGSVHITKQRTPKIYR